MIYVIDDDEIMAECVAWACGEQEVRRFGNAVMAMEAISAGEVPDLIFLDILLTGPNGFTLLHELMSYTDTAQIPVVVVSSLDFNNRDLSVYGVVGVLEKSTMRPEEVRRYVEQYVTK